MSARSSATWWTNAKTFWTSASVCIGWIHRRAVPPKYQELLEPDETENYPIVMIPQPSGRRVYYGFLAQLCAALFLLLLFP